MKTKTHLERLAAKTGATLEEDDGYRDMRVFQLVAPEGKIWIDGGVTSIRVEWAKGSGRHAVEHNEAEYLVVSEAAECGMEPMTEEQLADYA